MMTTLRGGCHCGNLKVAFETSLDPSILQLRACQCSFCRRHGAVTTSDPGGHAGVRKVVESIRGSARTGSWGDGRIAVSTIEDALDIGSGRTDSNELTIHALSA